ncbi:MAG: hypothetical protein NTX50_26915 [Candidatus Sumerlaeota bacterium]|nr:hypothetical protein [Candidatus Sumerlaeota bacterium]
MNDDASDSYVIADALLSNDGAAEQYTANISCAGQVNGAISFNGSSDRVMVPKESVGELDYLRACAKRHSSKVFPA